MVAVDESGDGRRAELRGVVDWTLTPAKWGAVGVLALAGCMGLAWSVIRAEGRMAAAGMGREARVVEGEGAASERSADGPSAAGELAERPAATTANDDSTPDVVGLAAIGPSGAEPAAESPPPAVEVVTTPAESAPAPAPLDAGIAQRVNINTASEAELQALPGIGEARAAAIVEDRRVNGPFRSVEELDRVRGIGPGIIEGLREFARVR